MPSLTAEIAAVLETVHRPGGFCTAGTVEFAVPALAVEGVGPVALPLLPEQADRLVAAAERAPYGRGPDTVLDLEVRRTWQIDAARVSVGGRSWPRTLESILSRVAEGLGVDGPIEAELYKLLLYAEGDFFLGHRDTEKAPGMFASLVIVLPSAAPAAGGALVVRHRGTEVALDLHPQDPAEACFAAFYADCIHEVTPVTTGHRLTLVYNLLWRQRAPAPQPPDYEAQTARIAGLLAGWAGAGAGYDPGDDHPDKLIVLLDHAYTQAELNFTTLKGADAAIAKILVDAAPRAGCALHLALLTVEERGIAEFTGYGRNRWNAEMAAVEATETWGTLSQWRRPDGTAVALGEMPFEDEEVSPPDRLEELEPDEEEFEEATGNAGASYERTYRRAALVLWPEARHLTVLRGAGQAVALPYLQDLAARWAAGPARPPALREEARALAGVLVEDWPAPLSPPYDGLPPGAVGGLLASLVRLEDGDGIDAFLERLATVGGLARADAAAVAEAADLLEPARAGALIARIVAAPMMTLAARARVLAAAVSVTAPESRHRLRPAAEALLAALPGDPAGKPPPAYPWMPQADNLPGVLIDLMCALGPVDRALAHRAVDHLLAWPKAYDPDIALVPAAIALTGTLDALEEGTRAAAGHLMDAARTHLRTRIAEPLEPPADWRRPSAVGCRCPHCQALSRFLADPTAETWSLRAVQADRSHVESRIRTDRCDVDTETLRKGSPHTLVCTKNQASYERRVAQRRDDVINLARLQG